MSLSFQTEKVYDSPEKRVRVRVRVRVRYKTIKM